MKKNNNRILQAILPNVLILATLLTLCAEESEIKKTIEKNTTIVSNQAEMDLDSHTFRFHGDVHLEGENLDAVCDELEVISKKAEGQPSALGGMDSFEKITAIGNVRINQVDHTIKAGHAVLYSTEGKVVLTQNPEVTNSQGTIKGHKITFYRNDGKAYVEGGPNGERPKIVLPNLNINKESEIKDKKEETSRNKDLTVQKY